MGISIVRLGQPRALNEGLRIGTVRRPPRGVPKDELASRDYYDVWFSNLAPSSETMKLGKTAQTDKKRSAFIKAYRREMNEPRAIHDLKLLAALSKATNFAVGCYCEHEGRCHRSVLRDLLKDLGAVIV